jgi:hypothetical protein
VYVFGGCCISSELMRMEIFKLFPKNSFSFLDNFRFFYVKEKLSLCWTFFYTHEFFSYIAHCISEAVEWTFCNFHSSTKLYDLLKTRKKNFLCSLRCCFYSSVKHKKNEIFFLLLLFYVISFSTPLLYLKSRRAARLIYYRI